MTLSVYIESDITSTSKVSREVLDLTGRVVITSLAAFDDKGMQPIATIMVDGPENGKMLKRALSLATQGDNRRPFTININSGKNAVLWVDGAHADLYHETLPSTKVLVIHDSEG